MSLREMSDVELDRARRHYEGQLDAATERGWHSAANRTRLMLRAIELIEDERTNERRSDT